MSPKQIWFFGHREVFNRLSRRWPGPASGEGVSPSTPSTPQNPMPFTFGDVRLLFFSEGKAAARNHPAGRKESRLKAVTEQITEAVGDSPHDTTVVMLCHCGLYHALDYSQHKYFRKHDRVEQQVSVTVKAKSISFYDFHWEKDVVQPRMNDLVDAVAQGREDAVHAALDRIRELLDAGSDDALAEAFSVALHRIGGWTAKVMGVTVFEAQPDDAWPSRVRRGLADIGGIIERLKGQVRVHAADRRTDEAELMGMVEGCAATCDALSEQVKGRGSEADPEGLVRVVGDGLADLRRRLEEARASIHAGGPAPGGGDE